MLLSAGRGCYRASPLRQPQRKKVCIQITSSSLHHAPAQVEDDPCFSHAPDVRAAACTTLAFLACHPLGARGDACLVGPFRWGLAGRLQSLPTAVSAARLRLRALKDHGRLAGALAACMQVACMLAALEVQASQQGSALAACMLAALEVQASQQGTWLACTYLCCAPTQVQAAGCGRVWCAAARCAGQRRGGALRLDHPADRGGGHHVPCNNGGCGHAVNQGFYVAACACVMCLATNRG